MSSLKVDLSFSPASVNSSGHSSAQTLDTAKSTSNLFDWEVTPVPPGTTLEPRTESLTAVVGEISNTFHQSGEAILGSAESTFYPPNHFNGSALRNSLDDDLNSTIAASIVGGETATSKQPEFPVPEQKPQPPNTDGTPTTGNKVTDEELRIQDSFEVTETLSMDSESREEADKIAARDHSNNKLTDLKERVDTQVVNAHLVEIFKSEEEVKNAQLVSLMEQADTEGVLVSQIESILTKEHTRALKDNGNEDDRQHIKTDVTVGTFGIKRQGYRLGGLGKLLCFFFSSLREALKKEDHAVCVIYTPGKTHLVEPKKYTYPLSKEITQHKMCWQPRFNGTNCARYSGFFAARFTEELQKLEENEENEENDIETRVELAIKNAIALKPDISELKEFYTKDNKQKAAS